jgi:aromatic-L-amino-acid decarboxylase
MVQRLAAGTSVGDQVLRKDIEDFRIAAHEMVDWVAEYMNDSGKYRVLPDMKPGDLVDRLPRSAPEQGESLDTILRDFEQQILPAVTHWNHPRFFSYFAISAAPPGVLAELLAAAINSNGLHWKSSPAISELEQVTMSWLAQWMGLPDDWFGMIFDTASISTMHAIAAARELADPEARVRGGDGNLVLYTSAQSHNSVEKAAIAIGIGQRNVRKIATDDEFRMKPDALARAIIEDLDADRKPFCVVATAGTTSTTSVDPLREIGHIAERHAMWMHVDAAYAGTAAIVPEMRWILDGAYRAQSLVTNPHKWMFVPVDLSVLYTSRPDILQRAFSLSGEYLKKVEDSRAVNLMDYAVPLGRRFRSLKLWFIMRYYGRDGVIAILREHIRMAQELARMVGEDERFEIMAPHPMSAVCFRLKSGDADNQRLIDAVNATGRTFVSLTTLNGKLTIRFAIGNMATTMADVEEVWGLMQRLAV